MSSIATQFNLLAYKDCLPEDINMQDWKQLVKAEEENRQNESALRCLTCL